MDKGEVQYVDATQYVGANKDGLSNRIIILEQYRKILSLSAVEFRGGYTETQSKPSGHQMITTKIYIPDSREQYSNAIQTLSFALLPHYDAEMEAAEKRVSEKDKEFKKEYHVFLIDEDNKDRRRYRSARLLLMQDLFKELCKLLFRKKYLVSGTMEE